MIGQSAELRELTPSGEPSASTSALERVLARFGDAVRRAGAAHGLSGADLDEVMQDVRIRLWRGGHAVSKLETLTASYVYRAAASAAIDMLRRRRARHEDLIEGDSALARIPTAVHTQSADHMLMAGEMARAIGAALDEMVANRRAVVRMYLKGYERDEIAALLGWSEAKTRNLLYRGLDDLRCRLIDMGIHP